MKKIILICNAGMTTGMLAKKIEKASDNSLEVKAFDNLQKLAEKRVDELFF